MPEMLNIERIHPCLLDRLTDSDPGNPLESRMDRVMSPIRYRQAVLRDLQWLFSTPRPALQEFAEEFPEIGTSVLNYGSRSLSGQVSDGQEADALQRDMRETMAAFEPRINPDSVSVKMVRDYWSQATSELSFDICGELWTNPAPEELFIKTKLDLETGDCDLHESRAS